MKNKIIHSKGQYFTKNEFLKENVYKLIKNNAKTILEPSVGRGDLVEYVCKYKKKINFDCYEIDKNIDFLDSINTDNIIFGDFLKQNITKKYDTIIGNPPFVKTNKGNLYIDFIEKCFNLLNENGEIIFIVPSDFIKLTSSCKVINLLLNNGTFTDIIHPNNENLFENASIDVIIFRYCKNKKLPKKTILNNKEKYLINTNGIITFSDVITDNLVKFSDYFKVGVGMVSGKENIFKNKKLGNIELLNGKNKRDKYIMIEEFPTKNSKLNKYLLENKEILMDRKIRKFNESNWFQWGAPRNVKLINENKATKCCYVKNITRTNEICFIGEVEFFGGGLIVMIPTKKINLNKFVKWMNSDDFKINYMYSGRFRIGHKQLSNCLFDPNYFI